MGNPYFQFKQFLVRQDRCAMKVSTDAVILGAVAGKGDYGKILDIGTGTGVLALMLAQRFPLTMIEAVEIDEEASVQAEENVGESVWNERIEVLNLSFQRFYRRSKETFDLIVSNPPYFPNHLRSPDKKRNQALHQDELSFQELMEGVEKLLTSDGEFWVILPEYQMGELEKVACSCGFSALVRVEIRDRAGKPIMRVVQSFRRTCSVPIEKAVSELTIKDEYGEYTLAYKQLLRSFMLHF